MDSEALARIWPLETAADLRDAIFDQLLKDCSGAASALLSRGHVAAAELLLSAAVDRKAPESPKAYAVYWLCRGRLDDAIRRWSSRGGLEPADTWAEKVLTVLYRAKGDVAAATLHAESADDPDLLRDTLLWAGNSARIAADLRRDNPAPQAPADVELQMGMDALAGDSRAVDADIVRLSAVARAPADAITAAGKMLLVDRPDDAVKLLVTSAAIRARHTKS